MSCRSATSRPARTFGDDAALSTLAITNRRLLDYEAPLRNLDDKRRVVELTSVAVVEPRDDVLESLSVEPD